MCVADIYLARMKSKATIKHNFFEFDPTDRPLIVQLTSSTPDPIIELANYNLFKGKIDGIDINCGCPQSCALDGGYGAALLKDTKHLVDMCAKIAPNIPYPLSIKCRLHESVDKTISILSQLSNVGVKNFTVHGRYPWQRGDKRGLADWESIKEIKRVLPDCVIIGNGDIYKHEDFARMIELTSADGAMSGYGALLDPSLFAPYSIPISKIIEDYIAIAKTHHNKLIDIQRHLAWLLKRHITSSLKMDLFECKTLEELQLFLNKAGYNVIIDYTSADKISYPDDKFIKKCSMKRKLKKEKKHLEKKSKRKKTRSGYYSFTIE